MLASLRRWLSPATDPPPPDRPDWRGWNARLSMIRAAYEAALPRDDLWTLADFRDADATLLPEIRRRIRSRTRYEYQNNPLVTRVVNVWVEDVVAETGPWIKIDSGDARVNAFIEQAWLRWWLAAGMSEKLSTAVLAEATDGEAVALVTRNPRILDRQPPGSGVMLHLVGLECDRLASPEYLNANRADYIDGVHLDPSTRAPIAYDLLRAHPGSEYLDVLQQIFEADTYPASDVLHAYRQRRPEQHRGVSRYVPVLPLSGLHRKLTEAHVMREQIRAAFAFVVKSMAPPEEEGPEGQHEDQWWQAVNLPNRQGIGMFLPEGYDVSQFRAESGSAELEGFHRIMAGQVSGCFTMPLGRALGVYGTNGYAPIRAELLPYHRTIQADRRQIWEAKWLWPLYRLFIGELQMTRGFRALAQSLRRDGDGRQTLLLESLNLSDWIADHLDLNHVEFRWPEQELVVDPSREEEARRKRLASGIASREDEIDAADLDAHDRRNAVSFGFDDSDEGLRQYRQLLAAAVHRVGGPPGREGSEAAD